MAWIDTIEPNDAEGELADVYKRIMNDRGAVANIMKVHSLHPMAMEKHLGLYMEIMFRKGGLSRAEREFVAVVVSRENGCEYCINHHAEALNTYWRDRNKIRSYIIDPDSVDLTRKEEELVRYALKLTREPNNLDETDISRLINIGFSQKDILALNLIVSYFNFVNRIALGLDVEWDSAEVKGYKY